jgi:hypothetical protein
VQSKKESRVHRFSPARRACVAFSVALALFATVTETSAARTVTLNRHHHHHHGQNLTPLPRHVVNHLSIEARRLHRAHPRRHRSAYTIFLRLAHGWRHAHARPAPDAVLPAIQKAADTYGFSPSGMVRVAQCESRLDRSATNGQYLGLFQLGGYARDRYLHGSWTDAYANALAAARYAHDAGGFSPWSCGYAY